MPTEDPKFDIAALEKEEATGTPPESTTPLPEVGIAVADPEIPETASLENSDDGAIADPAEVLPEAPDAPDDDGDASPSEVENEEPIDPCVKCGVEKNPDYPMCRGCGYYETLDTFVEVDDDNPDVMLGVEDTGGFKMPTWGWILIGIHAFLILESLFVTINFRNGHIVRMVWSIAQLLIGLTVALGAHARATFLSVMADADSDIGDFLLKPFKVWGVVIGELPKSFPLLAMVTSGAMAVLLSICLIRSIPFNKLFETDAPPPKAPNLAKAIADQAKQAEDPDMTMEEALDEFAGEGEDEDELELLRTHEQGVIIGYYAPDGNPDTISSLIVATAVKKKLEILGTFSAGLDDDSKAKLAEDLRQVRRKTPFVETKLSAKWVQPVYLCEISYQLDKKERPRELRFERVVGKAKLPGRKK